LPQQVTSPNFEVASAVLVIINVITFSLVFNDAVSALVIVCAGGLSWLCLLLLATDGTLRVGVGDHQPRVHLAVRRGAPASLGRHRVPLVLFRTLRSFALCTVLLPYDGKLLGIVLPFLHSASCPVQDSWNVFDFVVVAVSIADFMGSVAVSGGGG
jgi:hypothetical protein